MSSPRGIASGMSKSRVRASHAGAAAWASRRSSVARCDPALLLGKPEIAEPKVYVVEVAAREIRRLRDDVCLQQHHSLRIRDAEQLFDQEQLVRVDAVDPDVLERHDDLHVHDATDLLDVPDVEFYVVVHRAHLHLQRYERTQKYAR